MTDTAMIAITPYAFSYAGNDLEMKFETYRTTKVTGRGATSVLFSVDQVNVGSKIATQQLESRVIKVKYIMYYESFEDIRAFQRSLKLFLYRDEDVPIIFKDEPQIIYYGRLSKFDEDDVTVYPSVFEGNYEIYCQDPLKYSATKEIGTNITINSPVETTPQRIEVKMTGSSSVQIRNTSTNAVIKITGAAIYAGNIVTFDFEKGKIFVNGIDRTSILDLESDFENFYIHRNDILTCTNGTMTIYAREVYM